MGCFTEVSKYNFEYNSQKIKIWITLILGIFIVEYTFATE